ncbi:MAG: MoaD/ThiS family protein [Desulfovibrio sp.]|jgi:molybdopterin converting factor small subunit|nr:MoaD/ThiS family protein [Desulfovibrio sp.]
MATSIRIPTALRTFTEGRSEVSVEGRDVGEALAAFAASYPDIRRHLYDEEGKLRSFLNVYLGDANIKSLKGLETPLESGARLMLVPAIAGGAR